VEGDSFHKSLNKDVIEEWSMQLIQGLTYLHIQEIFNIGLNSSSILIGKNKILKISNLNLSNLVNKNQTKTFK